MFVLVYMILCRRALPCRRNSWLHVLGSPTLSLGSSGLLAVGVQKASFQALQVRLCKFKPQSLTAKPFEENLCCGSRATFLDGRQLHVDVVRGILLMFGSCGFETLEDLLVLGWGVLLVVFVLQAFLNDFVECRLSLGHQVIEEFAV